MRFMIKAPIFSRDGIQYVPGKQCSEEQTLTFPNAIEIGLYSLYRKKMIAAFDLNKKIAGSPVLVSEKKTMVCLSQPQAVC